MGGEDVEANGELFIGEVQEDNIFMPLFGDPRDDLVYKVAMRIEDPDAIALLNVLTMQLRKKVDLPVPDAPMTCM
jgi:hypothetical protein